MKEARNVTVRLPESLVRAANVVAAVEGVSLRAVVQRGLEAELEKQKHAGSAELAGLMNQLEQNRTGGDARS